MQGLKDKSRAGKGAIEGLLGPGAANNSTRGGDLIPTLAFGIPGSGAMALLLGAMLIVGLNPGPEMLKSRLDVTFSMVWVLIIANLIVAALCFLILNHLAALTFIRGTLLIPFLMFLVFIGSFTANNDLADIISHVDLRLYRLLHGQVRLAAPALDTGTHPRQNRRELSVDLHRRLRRKWLHVSRPCSDSSH